MLDLVQTSPSLMLVWVEMMTQTERSALAPAARAADPNGGLHAACGSALAPAASAERQLPLQTLMEPLPMC